MAAKRIQKQLFYKYAQFLTPTEDLLQDLFDKAVKTLQIADRAEKSSSALSAAGDADGGAVKLVNSLRTYSGCSFGVMVLYAPGIHHMVIDLAIKDGKDELDVSKFPPPLGKQFMETPLFFLIKDNHVVYIQSRALSGRDFENHLNWLLERAGAMDKGQRVTLSDAVPEKTRKAIEKTPIKAITIGVPLVDSVTVSEQTSDTLADKFSSAMSTVAKGLGLDALRGLLTDSEYAGLQLEQLTESPNIEVNLQIKVVGRRKKPKTDKEVAAAATENSVMSKLMTELRHVEDASFVQVETRGGASFSGNDLRVQVLKSVASYDGVLDPSDSFEVMRKWLETVVGNGTVATDV